MAQMISEKYITKIIKYIDYLYVSNYIANSLKYQTENIFLNKWKIFSICSNSSNGSNPLEKHNILYLVKTLSTHSTFTQELLLWTTYVYKKICLKLAHVIDNYVYLFGSIYTLGIKLTEIKYDSSKLLFEIFNIDKEKSLKMIDCVVMFIKVNNIFFNDYERSKIIYQIKSN